MGKKSLEITLLIFICKDLGVIIEIDDVTHEGKVEYDEKRDVYLKTLGLKVIHLLDSDVKKNLEGVIKFIEEQLRKIMEENTLNPPNRGNGKKYLFILGEKEGRDVAIVWREYSDNWTEEGFKKDMDFIIKELESWAPHIV